MNIVAFGEVLIDCLPEQNVIGGARKRAFITLSKKLGKGLCAVFMQSQDGWSDFKGKNDE